jgi:hypothetical protein
MHEFRLPSNVDQPSIVQLADMVRDGGLRYGKFVTQNRTSEFGFGSDSLKNVEPGSIGESSRDGVESIGLHEFSLATYQLYE